MHEYILRCLHAGFDLEPLYTGVYNPRWPPTPEEFTADMNVAVGSLRLEILHGQLPSPPQYDLTSRRSPAASTVLDNSGVPHTEIQQTEQEGTFPFKADVDGLLHVDCTRISEQAGHFPSQADVGSNHETTTIVQAAARQELAGPPSGRQQRGIA